MFNVKKELQEENLIIIVGKKLFFIYIASKTVKVADFRNLDRQFFFVS